MPEPDAQPDAGKTPGAQPDAGKTPDAPCTEMDMLFGEFEDRYRRESSEVRSLSMQMHEIMGSSESVLNELSGRSFWTRVWQRLTGHTSRLHIANSRNQLRIQQTNLLLTAAIVRQNRMIAEGLRLTLEKLKHIEHDAQCLRHAFVRMEERREYRRLRWEHVAGVWHRGLQWLRSIFVRSST